MISTSRGRWLPSYVLALLAFTLFSRPVAAAAQARELSGTVLDPDRKAVVNAAVVLRNETTAEMKSPVTDARRRFAVADVPAGTYTVEVCVPGFETVRKTGVSNRDGANEPISIQLSVANITETVTVSAALPAAAVAAPSQASLTARSAQSLI